MLQLDSEQMNEPCVFVPLHLFETCDQLFKVKFQPYFFLTAVSNYYEERKLKLLINVHIKRQEI